MVLRTLNGLLGKLGYRVIRKANPSADHIDPLDRNQVETLNSLWSDETFVKNYMSANRRRLYEEVFDTATQNGLLDENKRIVDVGCGPGLFLKFLTEKGFKGQIAGCDFSEAAIEVASKSNPASTCYVHDIYTALETRYDTLFCMEVLEHLMQPEAALKAIGAASDTLILTVPEGRKDTFRGHINFWSKESFNALLESTFPDRKISVDEFNDYKNLLAIIRSS